MRWKQLAAAVAAVFLGWQGQAAAQPGAEAVTPPDPSEEIIVEAPGPELWRLYDADSEVYILATINALPSGFRWNSRSVTMVLERADRLYIGEGVSVGVGDIARLLITRRDAFRNPDATPLRDYLPAALYVRLQTAARAQDLDMDELEQWRPYVAGGRVLSAALDNAGLDSDGDIVRETRRLARRAGVRVQELEFVSAGPLIDALNEMPLGRDNACLALQLDSVDQQLPALRARAQAWAFGDVAALRDHAGLTDPSACLSALGGAGLSFQDVERRVVNGWRDALVEALRRPGVRMAAVSSGVFLQPGGVLASLRAAGYTVEGP